MRNVAGDEAIDGVVDAIVAAGRAVAVGILIGRVGSSGKDFVVGLVQTPVKEDGGDAAVLVSSQSRSRSGAGSMTVSIDGEWVAEHARQVSRMLLGGLSVVGIYCLAPDNSFKQSASILCQVSRDVEAVVATSKTSKERLVLQISTSPRRLACKVCTIEANGSLSLKPCDWKLSKVIANLQIMACAYSFDTSIPVPSAADPVSYKNKLLSWTVSESKRIQSAEVLVNDELQDGESFAKDVQLMIPLDDSKEAKGFDNPTSIAGTINLKGSVDARAYGFPREPASVAFDAIKEDIVTSLRNRIEILCEEAEQLPADQAASSLLSNCGQDLSSILPKRVFLPWNGLLICDYQLPTETHKEINERYNDLFGQPMPRDILQLEQFFVPSPVNSSKIPSQIPSRSVDDDATRRSKLWSLIGTLFGILVPILIALAAALLRK